MKALLILSLIMLAACGAQTSQVCRNTSQVIQGTQTPQCTCTSNGQSITLQSACGGQ